MPADSVEHRLYTLLSHSALPASTNEPDNRRQIGRGIQNSKFKIQRFRDSEFQGLGEAERWRGGKLKIRGFKKMGIGGLSSGISRLSRLIRATLKVKNQPPATEIVAMVHETNLQ